MPDFGARPDSNIITTVVLCLLLLFSAASQADGQEQLLLVKAGIISKLPNFIRWPKTDKECASLSKASVPILVLGKSPLLAPLLKLQSAQQDRGQASTVKTIGSLHEITSCSLLIVAADQLKNIKKILKKTQMISVATVADTDGFGKAGILINLYVEKGNVRFEVNKKTLDKGQISISYKLLKLVRLIE